MFLTFFTTKPDNYRDGDPRNEICAALMDAFFDAGFEDADCDVNEFGVLLDLGDETLQANSYEELPNNVKDALDAANKQIAKLGYYCDLDEIIY